MFLRISKPLLCAILEQECVLERILTGGEDTLPTGTLPSGIELGDLLRTCRRYDASTQKAVQLVSYLVSLHAWLLMEFRPDADAPTLLTLRPGAAVLGSRNTATQVLASLLAAAAAVDATGKGGSGCVEAREEAAYREGFKLVARTRTPLPGTAALSPKSQESSVRVVTFVEGALHGQCKGHRTGSGTEASGAVTKVSRSRLLKHLAGLKKSAGDVCGSTISRAWHTVPREG